MTKKARIEQLEQQVARLEARIIALEARPHAAPSYPSWPSEPFPRVTWTQPNTTGPFEITSGSVVMTSESWQNASETHEPLFGSHIREAATAVRKLWQ